MIAALLTEIPSQGFEVAEVAEPELLAPEHVLVDVTACGVCGTDLHIVDGHSYRPQLPFVLGHEPVGVVRAVGSAVDPRWIGTRVTITLFVGAGEACPLCRATYRDGPCQRGDERLCPQLRSATGVHRSWGAFAQVLRVSASQLVVVPDELESTEAATLVDAGATAFNAVRTALALGSRRHVVAGAGAVGHLVAERLADLGEELVIVEPAAERRRAASTRHTAVATIDEVDGVVDCVIECSGAAEVVILALERLVANGCLVLAGYGKVPSLDLAPVARKELRIAGVRSGRRSDLVDALRAAAQHKIQLPTVEVWELSEINTAFAALRSGQSVGKVVIQP